MKIQYCSDLHLEFDENRNFMRNNPIVPIGDILVIAGDLCYLEQTESPGMKDFLQFLSDSFQAVYYIPGNHEFYGNTNVALLDSPLYTKILDNVFLVNNYSIRIENVQLIFTTLWSHIYGRSTPLIKTKLNDFHLIRYNNDRLTVNVYNQMHQSAIEFLKETIARCSPDDKTVVVSHHLPSFACISSQFKDDPLNLAFASNLNGFIEANNIQYWIYGHSHCNIPPVNIGETQLISNALGYASLEEYRLFRANAVIEI